MKFTLFFIFCFQSILFAKNDEAENKLVFLISPPRSLSVGFLRMIEARGDFAIYHEPLISVYDFIYFQELTKDWFLDGAYETYDQVKKDLFEEVGHSNVFVKEMSFSSKEFLIGDLDLMKSPNVHFVFLMRDPHDATISFYQRFNQTFEGFENVMGYRQLYELFEAVSGAAANPPLLLFSEDLASNPKQTVERFCSHVEIPFMENALAWKNLGLDFSASEWNECKLPKFAQHWHGEAIRSEGFGKLREYEVDLDGKPTFSEIKNEKDREVCKNAYQLNLPYYLKLKR